MFKRLIVICILAGLLTGQPYKYSTILSVPNLSFINKVFCGLDILEQLDFAPLRGKSIAIACGPGSVDSNGRHILDVLQGYPDITVKYIFVPEFGLFGEDNSRLKMVGEDVFDPVTGARIVDLFGRFIMPPKWSLKDIDLVLIDLADTGIRYSTYMTTATKIIESCAGFDRPVMVLDRPNPLNGRAFDGPIVRIRYQSFEGYHIVPIRHGFTPGEFLLAVNEVGWAKDLARVKLTIVPMVNWDRGMWQDNTGIPFIPANPEIRNLEALTAYCGMGLLKGTNLNYGQGTEKPFLRFGAPWMSSEHILKKLETYQLKGVSFTRIQYTPRMKQGQEKVPLYNDESCSGLELKINDRSKFDPLTTATAIILTVHNLYPREFQWTGDGYIDKLFGHELLRTFAAQGKPADYLPPLWLKDVLRFSEFRQQFLLY